MTVTYDSDKLVEDQPIPEDEISIAQGQVTVYEYGRAVPFTSKLKSLSEIEVSKQLENALRNRLAKVMDAIHAYAFKQSDLIYIPTGAATGTWDTDGVASTQATSNMNAFHFREIIDYMRDDLMIPPFFPESEEYVSVMTGKALRGIYDDPDFQAIDRYAEPKQLLRGEVGRYYHTRIVWTNHAGALAKAKGASGVLGECIFAGEDPVMHIVAEAPEIRMKTASDYGRSLGLAWYGLFGSGPTWEFVSDGEARAVWVTSS